jgi:hypothetical protein
MVSSLKQQWNKLGRRLINNMSTKNLFQNIVFATSVISAVTLSAPSIKTLVVERKWSPEQTWAVLAALGTTTATTWMRYLDTDGELHTPRGLPGRDPRVELPALIDDTLLYTKEGDS